MYIHGTLASREKNVNIGLGARNARFIFQLWVHRLHDPKEDALLSL